MFYNFLFSSLIQWCYQ